MEPSTAKPVPERALWAGLLLFCMVAFGAGCVDSSEDAGSVNRLRLAIHSEPPTLDWSLATDNVSFDVLTNIMEGLTQYNDNLEPEPAIAERWEFSADGKTITYHLRDDVFWTDGKPVTAHDFEYSWKRLLNPATAAEYAYFLFDVKNAYAYNSGELQDADQVGVRAVSDTILEVQLERPVIYFPSITTFMVTFPMRRDIVERYGDSWTDPENIVTNGPFTLDTWQHEYKLILKANDHFYEGRPEVDQVVLYVVREPTTELTLYETGELEMAELPPVAIPHYRKSPEYRNLPLLRGYYYGFDTDEPPFDDSRVRRALAHAIDRSQIPRILQGGEVPTASWIPKGMFAYNPDIGPHFDPETARRLLAEAGYPQGRGFPPFDIAYNTDATNKLIAEFVQDQWKKHLKLEVSINSMEWKVFLSRLKLDPPPVYRLGWGADFPDPDNFMNLFTSTSGNNHLNWGNPSYDALIAQGAAERDPEKRRAIYDEAQRILTERDAAIVSLFVLTHNVLVKPYVKGLRLNAMELLYLKRVRLEH